MNKKQNISEENRKKYKIPSGANFQLRSRNAIYISPSNSLRHELAKTIGGYQLRKWGDVKLSESINQALKWIEDEVKEVMKDFPKDKADFITEAVVKKQPDRRIDLVRLNPLTHFEFETNKKILKKDSCTIYL